MKTIEELLGKLKLGDERGQGVIEYILVIVLIIFVMIVAFNMNDIEDNVESAATEYGNLSR